MFLPRKRVKLESDRCKNERARDWTIEEVWTSFPNWMKLIIKEEKSLKEGLEKLSEKKDNMLQISCLAFWILMGCSPFWAKVN